jgi:hypothetical protein
MKETDYLEDMYRDGYFPNFLVDKIKGYLKEVVSVLESGETNINVIQEHFDRATLAINGLEAEFEEHDSELETGARESIGATVIKILQTYNIDLDVEDAIREREW